MDHDSVFVYNPRFAATRSYSSEPPACVSWSWASKGTFCCTLHNECRVTHLNVKSFQSRYAWKQNAVECSSVSCSTSTKSCTLNKWSFHHRGSRFGLCNNPWFAATRSYLHEPPTRVSWSWASKGTFCCTPRSRSSVHRQWFGLERLRRRLWGLFRGHPAPGNRMHPGSWITGPGLWGAKVTNLYFNVNASCCEYSRLRLIRLLYYPK